MKFINQIFKNRDEASDLLHEVLPTDAMKQEEWIILAISTGAVPIALSLSKKLNAEFDYLFTHKIFTEKNNECEIAIITETQEVVIHEELLRSFSLNLEDIYATSREVYNTKIKGYKAKYRNNLDIINLENKNVLLIDEGLNTGLTMMACIKTAINLGAKSISVATPIIPKASIQIIESIADDLYYVKKLDHFIAINFYYDTLNEITYKDIETINKGLK